MQMPTMLLSLLSSRLRESSHAEHGRRMYRWGVVIALKWHIAGGCCGAPRGRGVGAIEWDSGLAQHAGRNDMQDVEKNKDHSRFFLNSCGVQGHRGVLLLHHKCCPSLSPYCLVVTYCEFHGEIDAGDERGSWSRAPQQDP